MERGASIKLTKRWSTWSLPTRLGIGLAVVSILLGLVGVMLTVVFGIWPGSGKPMLTQAQSTTGPQSPIVIGSNNSVSISHITAQSPIINGGNNTIIYVSQIFTNSDRVMVLEDQLATARVEKQRLVQELAKTQTDEIGASNRLVALSSQIAADEVELKNRALKIKQLEARIPIQQLSTSDRARVTNAVATANVVLRTLRVRGTLRVGTLHFQ